MKHLLFAALICTLLSCGKDNAMTDQELLGTWVLTSMSGDCSGLPITGVANEVGCIDNPTLEVNCSIIEITGPGTLIYAYTNVQSVGTYTVDGDVINICTDRCLDYILDGSRLTLQTGTIPICDPLYVFTKSTTSLADLKEANQRKSIKAVYRNGQLMNTYSYNSDGAIRSIDTYTIEGNLSNTSVYSFTPLTATRTISYPSSSTTFRYEYYDEGIDRTRRDQYNSSGELMAYRLYFHNDETCWVERIESYSPAGQLTDLQMFSYSGPNCDQTVSRFEDGQLVQQTTITRDGMKYYATSTLLNILRAENWGNRASYTVTQNGEVLTGASYNSTFTYEGGFPDTATRTYLDGDVAIFRYEYE